MGPTKPTDKFDCKKAEARTEHFLKISKRSMRLLIKQLGSSAHFGYDAFTKKG
jgi:hypothetical protein